MGARSTMEITRNDAVAEIMRALTSASDEQISMILEDLIGGKHLYNFNIVQDYKGDWTIKYDGRNFI